jgi:hypothetical protein
MFHFSHMFWKFFFLSWFPSSRFVFILAFPLLLQPRKDACQPFLDIFQVLWQMVFLPVFSLCVELYQATGHSLIYWVQTTVITDEALMHTECCCSILQFLNYPIVLSYPVVPIPRFILRSAPSFTIHHECLVERLNHFHWASEIGSRFVFFSLLESENP